MTDDESGSRPIAQSVCAIAVTFRPDVGFAERINRITPQVGAVIIVDNGSDDTAVRMLHEIAINPLIALQLNSDNLGVASALNSGIARAIDRGFTWVLLLDQDSSVVPDMVAKLFAARDSYPDRDQLAVIGAGFLDVNRRVADGGQRPVVTGWEEASNVITSGSLIPLCSHAVVGPFREEFFIDDVDREYCLRARAKGLRIIKTREPLMSHAIGAYSQHRLLWTKKWTTNHSADRRYYIARNDTVLLHEYGNYTLGLWRLKSFRRCLNLSKRIALYEDAKAEKIFAVAQGWWDGLHGRLGCRSDRRSKHVSRSCQKGRGEPVPITSSDRPR